MEAAAGVGDYKAAERVNRGVVALNKYCIV